MLKNIPITSILLIISGILVLAYTIYQLYIQKLMKWILLLIIGFICILGGSVTLINNHLTFGTLNSYSNIQITHYCSNKLQELKKQKQAEQNRNQNKQQNQS